MLNSSKRFKKYIKNNKNSILAIFLLLAFVAWAGKGLFKYSVYSTHDMNHHISRSYDAVKTISEGHFPLRWAGSLNYKCGAAIFNFFYPLIYYLVIILHFLTGRIIFSIKVINLASLLFGTVFFYLWIKNELKNDVAAFSSSMLYLYAPYRFSLIFVRGSPEYLAYAIFPIVLYFFSKAYAAKTKKSIVIYSFLSAISGGFLTISHNFTVMFLMPILLLYIFVKYSLKKIKVTHFMWIIFSFISSFGLGAFFIGSALIESKFVKIGKTNVVSFRQQFPELWQLIRSKWGYFYSAPGTENDGMSFMLGYAQWLVLFLTAIYIIFWLYKFRRRLKKNFINHVWIYIWFALSVFTLYLMLPISLPIWERLPLLQDIQFPWRLLGIAVFTISALLAYFLDKVKKSELYIPIFLAIIILAFVGNRIHLLPQPVSEEVIYLYSDYEKLHYHRYSTTTLGDDILDIKAKSSCNFDTPFVSPTTIKYSRGEVGNTYGFAKLNMPMEEVKKSGNNVTFALSYFPKRYSFDINGVQNNKYLDCDGLVCFSADDFRNNENYISWKVHQTPLENVFNFISLGFLISWLIIVLVVTDIFSLKWIRKHCLS